MIENRDKVKTWCFFFFKAHPPINPDIDRVIYRIQFLHEFFIYSTKSGQGMRCSHYIIHLQASLLQLAFAYCMCRT